MTRVTDKEYYMEERLIQTLNLMCSRMTGKMKRDNLIVIDGKEGYGKSSMSFGIAYYIAQQTGRKFSHENVFFDVDELIKFAISTEEQIIIWDEAALGGMSIQWQNKAQQKLIQLLMTARKKRHFWVFNIPRFNKLNEYIILDRAIGMIHIYSPDELRMGYFTYYNSKSKDILYSIWKKQGKKEYMKCKTFRGTFPDTSKLINEQAYDKRKDKAIQNIIRDDGNLSGIHKKYLTLQYNIWAASETLKLEKNISYKEFAKMLDISTTWIREGSFILEKHPELFDTPRNRLQQAKMSAKHCSSGGDAY